MRRLLLWITSCVILLLGTSGMEAKSVKDAWIKNSDMDNREAVMSDWLVDLIKRVLGITVVALIQIIYQTLTTIQIILRNSVIELGKILDKLDPEAKDVIEKVISQNMNEASALIQPILAQLDEIIPVITSPRPNDYVSDLIESILGISLQELLTNITNSSSQLNNILKTTLIELNDVIQGLSGEPKETLKKTMEEILKNGITATLRPLLNMLHEVFPELAK